MRHNLPPRPIIKPPPATHPARLPPSAHVFKNTPSSHRLSYFIITRARTNHKHTERETGTNYFFSQLDFCSRSRLNDVSSPRACNTQNRCSLSSAQAEKRSAPPAHRGCMRRVEGNILRFSRACQCARFCSILYMYIISFTRRAPVTFFSVASFKRVLMIARSRLLSPKLMERSALHIICVCVSVHSIASSLLHRTHFFFALAKASRRSNYIFAGERLLICSVNIYILLLPRRKEDEFLMREGEVSSPGSIHQRLEQRNLSLYATRSIQLRCTLPMLVLTGISTL